VFTFIDIVNKIKNKYQRYYDEKYLFYKLSKLGVNIPKSMIFYGEPIFRKFKKSSIIFDDNVVLCSDPTKNDIGVSHPVILSTLSEGACIKIGKNTGVSGASIASMKYIEIGEDCLIGANVIIVDNDFHPVNPKNRRFSKDNIGCKEVIIKNNVFIGANSMVLKGVTIGENSVIAAGSIVTKDVEANAVYGGNPCVKIRKLA
jgi:acetyltransferase-like isoleucine patch superfamily enzyme